MFKNQLENSFTPRSILTYAVFGAVLYLCIRQLPVPDLLKDMMFVMQGFWFGEKIGKAQQNGGVK